VAHGFVGRVLEGAGSRVHRNDGGAQHLHAGHVEGSAGILAAMKTVHRVHKRRRGAVATPCCPRRLGDDALFLMPHAAPAAFLADDVVDLVEPGWLRSTRLR
jgi:hypothetical protein